YQNRWFAVRSNASRLRNRNPRGRHRQARDVASILVHGAAAVGTGAFGTGHDVQILQIVAAETDARAHRLRNFDEVAPVAVRRIHRDTVAVTGERDPHRAVDRYDQPVWHAAFGFREQRLLPERAVGRNRIAEHAAAPTVGVIQRAAVRRKAEAVRQLHVATD